MPDISTNHRWRFARIGGVDRVRIETGDDIVSLEQLDQKLWASLSCPTQGLELDSKTLELIDTDRDGRIRVPEIISAIKWVCSVLKDPNDLLKQSPELPLSSINDNTPEGKKLLSSAKQILVNLGKKDSNVITVEDTSDTAKIFAQTKFNGDGIIPVDSADDEAIKNLINDIISCVGSVQDRSGALGVSKELVDRFFAECEAYSNWWAKAEGNPNILPFGESTADALSAFDNVKSKIDDYFTRCSLVEFDENSIEALNPLKSGYESISLKNLSTSIEEVARLPISKIEGNKPLNLEKGINPAWIDSVRKFRDLVVRPVLGDKGSLELSEWKMLSAKFNDYREWLNSKSGTTVEKLGLKRVREILSSNNKQIIESLIDKDKSLQTEADSIALVDKLVRYYRDLYTLLKNFVSFYDFYSPEYKAIFQAGTLYIDGRSCDLCIRVEDVEKHSSIGGLSGIYLLYCECVSKSKNEKMYIVACLTNGDTDNLMVGRNGVFYDRKGNDWDATVVKIIENPISIHQAFWSPYKQIGRMIGEQIGKMASARERQLKEKADAKIAESATKLESGKKVADQAFDAGKFAGIFAAIGLAIGAIGTAIASVVTGFLKLSWWQMPLAIIGLILVISGPSMVIAYLKLRKRNLAPLLDANGWAINAQAIINIPFGNSLTSIAKLPKNAHRDLEDPFAKKKPWRLYIILLIFVIVLIVFLWCKGLFKSWLG